MIAPSLYPTLPSGSNDVNFHLSIVSPIFTTYFESTYYMHGSCMWKNLVALPPLCRKFKLLPSHQHHWPGITFYSRPARAVLIFFS